jgi:hypothetical protein
MSDTPAVTVLTRRAGPTRAHHSLYLASPNLASPAAAVPAVLAFDGVEAVEIVAPDRQSAMLLVDYAAPTFPVEVVAGPSWIVRFRPPPSAGDWVVDLLALVERWLKSAPLPCAKMRRGGCSYLIRDPLDAG